MFSDRRILLLYVITLLDVIVANALGPLLLIYTEDLPAKEVWITGSTALMLATQLAVSPAVGFWADKAGRRPALIATAIGSVLAPFLLLPVKAWGLLANRPFEGATNGMYPVVRSAITDLSPKEALVKTTGFQSFLVGTGSVVGPAFTGLYLWLNPDLRLDPTPVVYLAIGLAVLNVMLAFLVKETCEETEPVRFKDVAQKAGQALMVKALWQKLNEAEEQIKGIKPMFILNLLGTLSLGYFAYFVAFLTGGQLVQTPVQAAKFLVFYGGLALLANAIFFNYVVDRIDKRKAIVALAVLSVALPLAYTLVGPSETWLYVVAGLDAVSVSLLGGLIGGILSQMAKEGEGQGEVFGGFQALGGLASFLTALVNSLLAGVSSQAPFYFCAACGAVLLFWALRLPDETRRFTERKQPEAEAEPEAVA